MYQSKVLLAAVFVTTSVSLPTLLLAQTTTPTGTTRAEERDERRETILENQAERAEAIEARAASSSERQAAQEERQAERAEVREERRGALAAFRQERVINLAANISNRMDAATERLYNIIGRLETRIEKLRVAGYDTAAAEARLKEASATLAEAKTALSDIDTLVYGATTGDQPQTAWKTVRERYQTVAGLIRTTHSQLRETVALMKVVTKDSTGNASDAVQNDNATSTGTTSPNIIEII